MSAGQIAAAVVAVLLAGFAVARRRRLSTERTVGALLVALALAVYASGVLSALPDPKQAIDDVARALGPWTYALVGVMAFLETGAFVGLVAPGETVVIAGGVIAGQGEIDLLPLIGLVWSCAVLGDTTSFFIGRRLGRGFLERHGPRLKISHERLEQVERYFERHGGKTILIGRFIGLVRALAPFVAGSSGLDYRRFIPFSVVGTGLWATAFCVLGYVFWRSFDRVAHVAGQAVFGFGLTVGVIVGVVVAYRRRHDIRSWLEANRERPYLRPLFAVAAPVHRAVVRPLVRVAGPRVRFVWNRVTPGGLGLELTTAVAVGGAGLYAFALYGFALGRSLGPISLDRELLDLGGSLRSEVAVEIAKVVTDLGAFPVVVALVLAAAVVLALRRQPSELLVLVLGFALVFVAVRAAKDGFERPRPAGPLVSTSTFAYPSGHAAYSTAWIAAAIVVTRGLGLARQSAIVIVAIALAAAIGLSRVYLRAHYWSDVVGGWGLGIGIFAVLGSIALIVEHMRHNGTQETSRPPASADP